MSFFFIYYILTEWAHIKNLGLKTRADLVFQLFESRNFFFNSRTLMYCMCCKVKQESVGENMRKVTWNQFLTLYICYQRGRDG